MSKEIFQKYFDQAAQAIIAQGRQSVDSDIGTSCVYRSPDGLKCAVGHLISDEDMQKFDIAEGMLPSSFPEEFYNTFFPNVNGSYASLFLEQLQNAHDICTGINFLKEFKSHMNNLAEKFGLRGL